jgi:hypothetical protein
MLDSKAPTTAAAFANAPLQAPLLWYPRRSGKWFITGVHHRHAHPNVTTTTQKRARNRLASIRFIFTKFLSANIALFDRLLDFLQNLLHFPDRFHGMKGV